MTNSLGEAVRAACLEAAITGYEDAASGGLCHEGAWEAAVSAIRALDLEALAPMTVDRAAAGTGGLAAALLERVAVRSALDGPEGFRTRARAISSRATRLASALRATPAASADSVIDLAMRCAQVATLAAEISKEGCGAIRSDAAAAVHLAASAAECALALAEEKLRAEAETDSTRSTMRRLWRIGLLLRRARPAPESGDSA